MVKMKCPVCGCVTSVPEGRAGVCCFCNYELSAPAALRQMPFAEPVPRPKISLEKAPRVNLRKDLPAAPAAALPQRVPEIPRENALIQTAPMPQESDAQSRAADIRQVVRWHLVNAALYAAQYFLSQLSGRPAADQPLLFRALGGGTLWFMVVFFSLWLVPVLAHVKCPRDAYRRLGKEITNIHDAILLVLRVALCCYLVFHGLSNH